MLKFRNKVNPSEGLLGMYITTNNLRNSEHAMSIVQYFSEFFAKEKKKAVIPFPLIMTVDPSLA